jgi:nucleotide-binding universal stress UspA family protein
MKSILYATDYSDNSVSALKYAYELSLKMKTQLFVVHVYKIPVTLSADLEQNMIYPEIDYFEINQTRLEEFVAENLGDEMDKRRVKMEALESISVLDGINLKAKELDTLLIVTGMKGKGGLADVLVGSTTKRLIEKAPSPVLAIPENVKKMKIKTMVYATDFEEEDIEVIQMMVKIAKTFNAEIHIVHFTTKDEDSAAERMEWFKDQLKQKLVYKNLEFEVFISHDIYESLQAYIVDMNADLVGMLERKKSGFLQQVFHRDLVKKMASYGRIPLLSFNEKNYAYKVDIISTVL